MRFSAILAQGLQAVCLLGMLSALPALGSPLYQITFNGVIQSGSLHGIDSSQVTFAADFVVGAPVSGTMLFDLGLGPDPTITDFSDGKQTVFDSSTNPVWVGGSFTLQLPDRPANALPVPSTFVLAPNPVPAGGTDQSTPVRGQRLSFSYATGSSTVLATANYNDSWVTTGLQSQHGILLGALISTFDDFLPKVPGATNFIAPTSLGGSAFQAVGFSRDPNNVTSPLFGITENYSIGTSFLITDAVGSMIDTNAPEPGTWLASLAGLTLLWLRRRQG